MKRRFIQWALISGITALASIVALVIDAKPMIQTFEPLLELWLDLCRAITPDSWETLGNIPLAIAWMGSGIYVYSAAFGAIVTFLLSLIERWRNPDSGDRPASPSGSWWQFCLKALGLFCLGALGFAVVILILLILSFDTSDPQKFPDKGMPKLEDIGDDQGEEASGAGPAIPATSLSVRLRNSPELSREDLLEEFKGLTHASGQEVRAAIDDFAKEPGVSVAYVHMAWSAESVIRQAIFADFALALHRSHPESPVSFHFIDCSLITHDYSPLRELPGWEKGKHGVGGYGEILWMADGRVIDLDKIGDFTSIDALVEKAESLAKPTEGIAADHENG